MMRVQIDDLIEAFAAHLADDPVTSPRTAEFYVADLREFARFLEERDVSMVDDARVAAVIRLMLDTGVTVSEIRALLEEDVELEAAQIHLGGPGSHLAPRVRRLSGETVEAVRRYLSTREDETPELIVARAARPVTTSKTLQNAIWKRCDQVGMAHVSPMNLRHTFAIGLLRRGASLGELKEALGVRDTSNIGVYKKFV